jgi:hypothetical protein
MDCKVQELGSEIAYMLWPLHGACHGMTKAGRAPDRLPTQQRRNPRPRQWATHLLQGDWQKQGTDSRLVQAKAHPETVTSWILTSLDFSHILTLTLPGIPVHRWAR